MAKQQTSISEQEAAEKVFKKTTSDIDLNAKSAPDIEHVSATSKKSPAKEENAFSADQPGLTDQVVETAAADERLKYICVKKCHHWVSVRRPEVRKVFVPGEEYIAIPGEQVPGHFRLAEKGSLGQISAEIFKATQSLIPPNLRDKKVMRRG